MARLSAFITDHSHEILEEWEAFARKMPASTTLDVPALRDDAEDMLGVIVSDLASPETENQRDRKARGLSDTTPGDGATAASKHGVARAERGFSIESTIAEFRALRASVIRLWLKHERQAGAAELEEVRRFDEAIDQAIAESVAEYTREVESDRERFLAVLGHDLRTPLAAVLTSTRFVLEEGKLSEMERTLIAGAERSGRRMSQLVDDLLVMALMRFGESIPVHPQRMDMGALVRDTAAEVGAAAPTARIEVETHGALAGDWDRMRIQQALTNLLSNALQHGTPRAPIRLVASGDDDKLVTISVTNVGRVIPREEIRSLFDGTKSKARDRDRRHLGLGLYIVKRIVDAHGGKVDVQSSTERGTTFTVTIPRDTAAQNGVI